MNTNNTPDVIDRNELMVKFSYNQLKQLNLLYLDFNVLPTGATFPSIKKKIEYL